MGSDTFLAAKHKTNKSPTAYTRSVIILFFIFSAYLVLPLIDVPFMGLSISAPIFFLISLEIFFKSSYTFKPEYRQWLIVAIFIWISVSISALGNGLLSGGTNFDRDSMLYIIRYAYWLLVFYATSVIVSSGQLGSRLATILGWSILTLALLRWIEVLISGILVLGLELA